MYPIYNYNWRNINNIYIYKTRLASDEIFSSSSKINREVGRAKDLSAPPVSIIPCSNNFSELCNFHYIYDAEKLTIYS